MLPVCEPLFIAEKANLKVVNVVGARSVGTLDCEIAVLINDANKKTVNKK